MNSEKYVALSRVMQALANPVRLRIVEELGHQERCLCELQPLFSLSKSTLSRHVTALRNVGIVSERKEGVRRVLRLETPCILDVFKCTMGVLRAEARRKARLVQ